MSRDISRIVACSCSILLAVSATKLSRAMSGTDGAMS
jgi:hypothetical protein